MPLPPLGLRHVALRVRDLVAAEHFYVTILGMEVEWRPDPDNVYLTFGGDSLALHRTEAVANSSEPGALDHLGFLVPAAQDVDTWAARLAEHGIALEQQPRTHRDGARSLYVRDPAGNLVQLMHYPRARG